LRARRVAAGEQGETVKESAGQAFRGAGIWRFVAGFLWIVLFTLCLTWLYRLIFAWLYRAPLETAGAEMLLTTVLLGGRFDLAVVVFVLSPALLVYHLLAATGWLPLRQLLFAYLTGVVFLVPFVGFADLQYFEEAGKHLTYEATAYLNLSAIPIVSGAFQLHPWISSSSLLACLAISVFFVGWLRRLLDANLPPPSCRRPVYLLALPVWAVVVTLAVRGGVQSRPLDMGDCSISGNPYVNSFCLNPLYSVLATSFEPSDVRYRFFDEEANSRTVLALVGSDGASPPAPQFPLLRTSPGVAGGNRKNVVLFILESWSGEDVVGLGGDEAITPTFARLSAEGRLFTHFYATGIRSLEGIFSSLCSFPNQPQLPVLKRPLASRVHWRSLSEILNETGYETMFIHGRDLDFDNMGAFLKVIGFQKVIDRWAFPPSIARGKRGSWPGYDDEEVMRRADKEFKSAGDRPFFGVIYTMNSHPPFVTPDDFPLMFEPDTVSNRFLNSLHYSDHSLQIFFDLARNRAYFQDTIFLFVADHARTRGELTLSNQHHIPFLIYAPGYVDAGVNPTVASQLDILPTVLGLLNLSASHASFGRDLTAEQDTEFAMSVSGSEVRWREGDYLLNDALTEAPPFLCDNVNDPQCEINLWGHMPQEGARLQARLRSYLSLSQTLLFEDRVYPRSNHPGNDSWRPEPEEPGARAVEASALTEQNPASGQILTKQGIL
jgi:phosphoglycerol transferase MdoB-like AlkP superfamily enzyme